MIFFTLIIPGAINLMFDSEILGRSVIDNFQSVMLPFDFPPILKVGWWCDCDGGAIGCELSIGESLSLGVQGTMMKFSLGCFS